MTSTPLIEIHNATVYRGKTRVFEQLNLELMQAQTTAVLGPNGCGKTTLLKLITRELYPLHSKDSRVRILGKENWNVWELRTRIGVVSNDLQMLYRPKTPGLDVVLSGFQSSIGVHGQLADKISDQQINVAKQIMTELDIAHLEDRALRNMSTGQQRRCLLARALVHQPETLILDEPTSGLDLPASFAYRDCIKKLRDQGKTIVLVTHMLDEINDDFERVILMRAGKIIADGKPEDVLTEKNLQLTYDIEVKLTHANGHYFASPKSL